MSEAMIVAALLATATGLAFAHMRATRLIAPLSLFAGVAVVTAILPHSFGSAAAPAAGISTIIAALAVYWPRGVPPRAALALAVNGGLWCGGLAHAIDPHWLPMSLAGVMVAVPGRLMARSSSEWLGMALQILAGWAAAIAVLTTALPYLMTPGSQSDHVN